MARQKKKIANLEAENEELRGQLIKMAIDLDYYKRKCENYKHAFGTLDNQLKSGASCE